MNNQDYYNFLEQERRGLKSEKKGRSKAGRIFAGVMAAAVITTGAFFAGYDTGSVNARLNRNEAVTAENDVHNEAISELNYAYTSTSYMTTSGVSYAGAGYSSVYKTIENSVVSINTSATVTRNYFGYGSQEVPLRGAGSGIIFYEDSSKIYIVTNYHVINGAQSVTITLDDEIQIPANYVGGDAIADIAVISVNKSDLRDAGVTDYKTAVFGDSNLLEIGDFAMAVGNALGEGKSATVGIISAKNKLVEIDDSRLTLIQTDAAINKGNSGGALVNINGEVIGINTAKLSETGVEGMGYAIPSNTVVSLIDEIMKNGVVIRPYLGVGGRTVTAEMVEEDGYPAVGCYIEEVYKGYTADTAGVKPGDTIVSYNGTSVTTFEQLAELVKNTGIGETVELGIVRCVYQMNGFRMVMTGTEELTLTAPMANRNGDLDF